ncbi:blue copper protein [Melia azedarach]|uniref:Blue copper protein n=1 Tax=Melia azedarach TaxID=155640 RepID=A0ACC1Z2M8_MELAZ|nr:blue copper protein [Melia azedarach]
MAVLRILVSLAATAMLIQLAMATNYTVGGPNGGWDITTDLQSWASSQSFLVGDNLIFLYGPNSHNVLEVSKADYDSCQPSSVIQSYKDGSTVIKLSSPGKRYFICGIMGHCSQGMKLEINTLATSSPPAPSPATPPAATPVTPAPQASPPLTPEPASPSPEISTPSPAESPKSAPTKSPVSPSSSPKSGPPSPDVPSAESPATSPTSSGLSPPPQPSSATKGVFKTSLIMGLSCGILMLLAF